MTNFKNKSSLTVMILLKIFVQSFLPNLNGVIKKVVRTVHEIKTKNKVQFVSFWSCPVISALC